MPPGQWVLLSYRLPREPSSPRIALWRALRRIGAVQVLDGLVALPADNRTRERLEWLADSVLDAGGEAMTWVGQPGSAAQERTLAQRMQTAVGAEYAKLAAQAQDALAGAPAERKRTLGRLRRELLRIRRRDYFLAPEREEAGDSIAVLAQSLEAVSP